MNPFESARIEAAILRDSLEQKGIDLNQAAFSLATAACAELDVALRSVRPDFSLLNGADATINVQRKWAFVRSDVPDELKAFLVAHEIGHLRLHPASADTIPVNRDALNSDSDSHGMREVESYGARERQELQANVFAREFLLPRRVAREAFLDDQLSASQLAAARGLPVELVRLQLYDAILLPRPTESSKSFRLPDIPTPAQEPAVSSDAKVSLIEAGPGTGKTTTLLLRLRRLIASGVAPEAVVILTFSNKAARELVDRARAGNIPRADRVWIGTFHAFGLEFLRKFGHLCGLGPRFPVLDKLAALAMLEDDLPSAELKMFDALGNPSPWLENAVDTIRRAKDELFDARKFADAIARSSGDTELDAKRRDIATIFERYELLLARRHAVDLADLLCVPIRLMQSNDPGVLRFLAGIQHLMVDEYQDVNRASALLVKELARSTRTLWVVGDANQAIYAFMGASSSNLEHFQSDFPGAMSIPLSQNHRSSQEIVNTFGEVARKNPAGRPALSLVAQRGYIGVSPALIATSGEHEQLQALASTIRQLQAGGAPLAEQAIIAFTNAEAATVALGLEQTGLPVLYLGNIFERPEIKDLICLLQLAVDAHGVNLVRHWQSPLLALSRSGADAIFAQTNSQQKSWREVSGEGLSSDDRHAWQTLIRVCALVADNLSPWDALSAILLEDGAWMREMCGRQGQAAANALMAIWQFVHFCRTPDGTGRWSTVKNLPYRIRDRVRLSEDRSMRAAPPEAEGMEAVRILTAHGSKGLEFDAVHLLSVTKRTYEPTSPHRNGLVPDQILPEDQALAVLKNERHNLLYVAVSRPRFYLTVYSTGTDELPSSLSGLLVKVDGGWQSPAGQLSPSRPAANTEPLRVSLDEYLQYATCPQRHELSKRSGRPPRRELQLYRALELATRGAMKVLAADPSLLSESRWRDVVVSALEEFGLEKSPSAGVIRSRVEQQVERGRRFLAEGGLNSAKIPFAMGSLLVELQPDQLFADGERRRLRFIRVNENGFSPDTKRALAALLDAHHRAGGAATDIEFAILSTGAALDVGTIRPPTRLKYAALAEDFSAKRFPPAPASPRTCHTCAYMFPCAKRSTD